jgi:hypothetical protein
MQQIGGPQVLRDQLIHLANFIEGHPDSLLVRVLPFETTPLGMTGASTFHLLDFVDSYLPSVAYRESITTLGTTDDPDIVDFAKVSYSQAEESCLDREASFDLIRERIDELSK